MKTFLRNTFKFLLLSFFTLLFALQTDAQTTVKKAVFQAFWWDYWNNNFPNGWCNYLTELAPRLRSAGFDAVWVPPSYKNASTGSVGYSPFDAYDLGDKYQKGGGSVNTKTRIGTKDEYLRMVAVMHANGIEVIQDVVLNHNDGAGSNGGLGGQDTEPTYSMANASGYKNFRYTSYLTPLLNDSTNDYWSRSGRWSKNYPNYYPNLTNNCTTGDICTPYFGPDISYESGAYGQSSNIPQSGNATIGTITRPFYNPVQTSNYMRDNARNWLIWLKKQSGVDGWRWDAVKHFPINVQEDLIYSTKYSAGFANGDQNMFNVGEWIGTATELDAYVNNIQTGTAPGGVSNEKHTGTFDFSIRGYGPNGGIYGMVNGFDGYNMQNLPGEQQGQRYMDYPGGKRVYRSVPFVNSHDTYRPILDANGNFAQPVGIASGWNTGSELGGNGQHIDPREPRLAAAYASICAIDGNPAFFFEDVFDIGTTGKRYTHLPTSTTDLPIRGDLLNILQAHQKLDFKKGSYAVPSSLTGVDAPFYQKGNSGDHLVIDRVGQAIIGLSDKYNAIPDNSLDQEVYVTVDASWINKDLYDYSGAHGVSTTHVFADRRVLIKTAPVGHTIAGAYGHGYSVWAPAPIGVTISSVADLYNYIATYVPTRDTVTVQEWEMANDLGDSHCNSLGQGGALPTNSTSQRVAGKIYASSTHAITVKIFPQIDGTDITASLWDLDGNKLFEMSGVTSAALPLTGNYTTNYTGWVVVKIRNTTDAQAGQKCWVNVAYAAPKVVDTRATTTASTTRAAIWTANKGTTNTADCGNWEEGRLPDANYNLIIPINAIPSPVFNSNVSCKNVFIETGASAKVNTGFTLTVKGDSISGGGAFVGLGGVQMNGAGLQTINGAVSFSRLEINNTNKVKLINDIAVTGSLVMMNGNLMVNAHKVALSPGILITGGSSSSFVECDNAAMSNGGLYQVVNTDSKIYPVGNTSYTPITLTNSGAPTLFKISVFDGVLQNGTSGAAMATTGKVKKTWVVDKEDATTVLFNLNATLQWNANDEDATFNRSLCAVTKNANTVSAIWIPSTIIGAAIGSGPYTTNINMGYTGFTSSVAVFSDATVLPVTWLEFSGSLQGKQALLKWSTGSEINNKGFNVERSLNGTEFTAIGFVKANGSAASMHNYQFADEMKNKRVYYRLQQIDNNGRTTYSKVIVITNNATSELVKVLPNPVVNTLNLMAVTTINTNDQYSVEVINAQGVRLVTYKGSFEEVRNAVRYSLVGKPAGLYLFVVANGDNIQRLKVIKQ